MSTRARRFFGCFVPLVLTVFGCGACLLTGYAGRILVEIVTVRDDAMAPILETGAEAVVAHAIAWTESPYRGQVLQVRPPDGAPTFRRVVAIPGDSIEVIDGVLYRDGQESEPALHRKGTGPDYGPVTLGEEEYFFLADDRDAPDSRTWGPLMRDAIFGEPMFHRPPGTEAGLVPNVPVNEGREPTWWRNEQATVEAQGD